MSTRRRKSTVNKNIRYRSKAIPKNSGKGVFLGMVSFLSAHKIIAILAAVMILLVLAAVIVLLVVPTKNANSESVYEEPVMTLVEELEEATEIVATDNQPQIKVVGLLLGDGQDKDAIADGFGKYANELITKGGRLDKYYIYKSGISPNQQIQDARSLINRGCNAIVLYSVDNAAYDIIKKLCDENSIDIIGIEGNYKNASVKIKSSEAWYGGYAGSVADAKQGYEKILLITDSDKSEFTTGVLKDLSDKGIVVDNTMYVSASGFDKNIEKALADAPEIILVKGNYAQKTLLAMARKRSLPEVFVTRATAGIIRDWYRLKNEGIVIVEAVAPSEDDPEGVPEQRIASEDALLYAYAGQDGEMLGRAACRFAYNFSCGFTLVSETEYIVSSDDIITDEDIAELMDDIETLKDDKYVSGSVDFDEIDSLFTEAG